MFLLHRFVCDTLQLLGFWVDGYRKESTDRGAPIAGQADTGVDAERVKVDVSYIVTAVVVIGTFKPVLRSRRRCAVSAVWAVFHSISNLRAQIVSQGLSESQVLLKEITQTLQGLEFFSAMASDKQSRSWIKM
ncbi:hypothetical protein M422DRAFT_243745 [Sphaerobolus stellatus SS14]|nr:hypothetical protein M422DRAFT_243745 [Sphaerobolus stellatus SS14]